MKKLLCVALCAIAGSACAATGNLNAKSNSGFYLGAQAGYAQSNYKSSAKLDKSGVAARIDAGYLFTPNFAVEASGVYLPNIKEVGVDVLKSRYLLDVFAKGIFPIQNNFSVFGKAGLAWYHQEKPLDNNKSDSAVTPALGLGVSYSINPQLSADLDYTYYFKKGSEKESHFFESTHFIGVGLTYNFGA